MTKTERYLKDHWFATRSIGRLMLDLDCARAAYAGSSSYLPSAGAMNITGVKAQRNISPVETAVIVVSQQQRAEIQSIERRLKRERAIVAHIEQAVADAQLNARESEFVRLRYFENQRMQVVSRRMYCSLATCGRIRESMLEKLGRAHGE